MACQTAISAMGAMQRRTPRGNRHKDPRDINPEVISPLLADMLTLIKLLTLLHH